MPNPTLLVISGPTATGKTKLSLSLAKHFHTEILSADSRQFYKELTIGTAKPTEKELNEVKHHFINALTLEEEYNIGRFEQDALTVLDQIFKEKKIAILCGGSGLYIQAVCNGMDALPQSNPTFRAELNTLFDQEGIGALQEKLQQLDPEYFEEVDIANPHRLIRAIEVCLITGRKYSELRRGKGAKRNFNIIKIGLTEEREKLYQKINERVDAMMNNGLLEETKRLYSFRHLNALNTVGYKELFNFFDGNGDLQQAVGLIKQNTRNYAKRQMTWFKKDAEITWFNAGQGDEIVEYIENKMLNPEK